MDDQRMSMRMTETAPLTSEQEAVRGSKPAGTSRSHRFGWGEIPVAILAFAALCIAVLVRSTQLLEPDDAAYRASIVALTQGHLLTLTNVQYQELLKQLSSGGGMGIA